MATRNIHSEITMVSGEPGRFDGNPLDAMERSYTDQLALCDELEEIADSLPDNVDRQKSIHAARSLWPLIRSSHSFEENSFFPMVRERLSDVENLDDTIARLRQEHTADECYAEELTDTLFRLGAGDKTLNAETMGYMLRGFFESLRRHIAFEREHILQVARSSGRFENVDGTRH